MSATDALNVANLTVAYGGLVAVDDVTFSLPASRVLGLIGPNGAGKTTTIDALTGFVPNAHGSIKLDGQRIDGTPPHARARAGLVRTFQSVELFDDLTITENLIVAAHQPRWWSMLSDAFTPKRNLTKFDVSEAIELAGIEAIRDVRPPSLSHGQRRLVGVARALAARPKVVLLDEPAAGLDPAETEVLGTLIRRLPQLGVAVLLVDHDMSLVLEVCDDLVVLDFGRVIAAGPPHEVRTAPAVIEAYLGGAQ